MKAINFIEELTKRGVELWVEGDKLCYRATKDILNQALLTQIKQNKQQILQQLRNKHAEIPETYPLSYGQQALWFLYQNAPESTAYHIAAAIRFLSKVNVPALRRACQTLIARHPSLHTTFTMQKGIPVQKVHRYPEVCFEEMDASTWTEAELKQRVRETYLRPFD